MVRFRMELNGVKVARRSINEAAKVFLAAFVLGPPIGGIVVMTLLQVLPWIVTDFADPMPHFGANLMASLLLAVPLSYFTGGTSALIAGLALAAYVAWGYRLTLWACLVAALIYPAVLAVNGFIATYGSPTLPPVMLHAAMIAIASASAALISYLVLRNTALVRRLNAPVGA
jgi:hypothetical protein